MRLQTKKANMGQIVKVLIAEDSPTDAEIVKREVKKTIPNTLFHEVDTKKEFIDALRNFKPDIVLSDYNMPSFTGIEALQLTLKISPITPLIIVTGSINEETAVNCMKAGANDYVIKEYIKRLGQAVVSALEKKEINLKKIKAENSLKESEENYRRIFENIQDVYYEAKMEGEITAVSPSIKILSKGLYSPEDIVGKSMYDFYFTKVEREILIENLKKHGAVTDYEICLRNRDASVIPCSISAKLIHTGNGEEIKIIGSMRDISARKEAENQLLLLRKAIEQSPVIIMITDPKGNIEYVNPALTSVTGFSFEEVKGKNAEMFRSEEQDEKIFYSLGDTILSGKDWKGELLNKKKNGEHYWEEAVISPIINEEDEITHFVAIKEDISEKKTLIHELVNAKDKAEESDRLKSAFLANMSHEIRTPMNGILGFVELLKQPKLTGEEQISYVKIIEQSGERMLNTLNDLIDISRIEAGQVKLFYDETNINQILDELYKFFLPEVIQKGLTLNISKIKQEQKALFYTDKEKLYAILANLLKNAIKYTYEGEINIQCEVKENGFLFQVSDTGIGINPDRIEAVFDRFVQEDITKTRPFEGCGLGLSIAKAYAKMLGGDIRVESSPGKGSNFYTFIKKHEPAEKQRGKDISKSRNGGIGQGKYILLAEDEFSNYKYMETLLIKEKFNVIHAENGIEAIQKFKENPQIDLILMDFKMPEMGGYEATKKIREFDKQIPIIAQTAYAMAGDKEKAFNIGCSDYITKPIKWDVLLTSIKKFL